MYCPRNSERTGLFTEVSLSFLATGALRSGKAGQAVRQSGYRPNQVQLQPFLRS